MKEIDKIALIEIKDGSILSARSKGKKNFYLPGGKREEGESDEEALIREISEELSVPITPNTLEHVGTFRAQSDGHSEGIIVKMTCYRAKYTGQPTASSEIEEVRWLNYKDYNIISAVDKIIFDFLKERGELV